MLFLWCAVVKSELGVSIFSISLPKTSYHDGTPISSNRLGEEGKPILQSGREERKIKNYAFLTEGPILLQISPGVMQRGILRFYYVE